MGPTLSISPAGVRCRPAGSASCIAPRSALLGAWIPISVKVWPAFRRCRVSRPRATCISISPFVGQCSFGSSGSIALSSWRRISCTRLGAFSDQCFLFPLVPADQGTTSQGCRCSVTGTLQLPVTASVWAPSAQNGRRPALAEGRGVLAVRLGGAFSCPEPLKLLGTPASAAG